MGRNDQPKWILAAAGVLASIGIGGVALASGDTGSGSTPDSLHLRDSVPVASATVQATGTETFERGGPLMRVDGDSFTLESFTGDSPHSPSFATASLDSPTLDSPNSPNSPDSPDSFDTVNSVDSVSFNSPETADSAASAASVDSPASFDSPDSLDSV